MNRRAARCSPSETAVSFEIRDGGMTVLLDVDLPEIEDMPTKAASVPQRGLELQLEPRILKTAMSLRN